MADVSKGSKKLKYEEQLSLFKKEIHDLYHESEDIVFRNTLSDPPTILDSTPQSKRREEGDVDEFELELTEEDVALMSDQEKKDYIGEHTLSVFKSYDKCRKDIISQVRHIAKKYSIEEAVTYLWERRGPHIAKLQLSGEVGLLEKKYNKKGHANLLLYENVVIDDYITQTWPPIELTDIFSPSELSGLSEKYEET